MPEQCPKCGNDMGYADIHANLHSLFSKDPRLLIDCNDIIIETYKIVFDDLFRIQNSTNYPRNMGQTTPLQRIDREIRNILQPSQVRRKSRELEQEVRAKYARSITK